MPTQNEASTQVEYKEQWGVASGKEVFILDEKQIQILKQADLNGHRGIVWFDKFAVSIPHIQSIYLISRQIKNQLTSGTPCNLEQTPEDRERARRACAKVRRELVKKGLLKR